MKYAIDRFEEAFAVLESESGEMSSVPRELIPFEASEGDVLAFDGEIYTIDKAETAKRGSEMKNRLSALLRRGTNNDE